MLTFPLLTRIQDKLAGSNTFYYFLTISNVKTSDGGIYYARLADAAQSLKLYFKLLVKGNSITSCCMLNAVL